MARIPWLQGSWNHIGTNTPFAVDPHEKKSNIFGTARLHALREINLRANIYEWTYPENRVISNELSNLNLDKKHLQKRHRIFSRDREPGRIPVRTLERLSNKSRKVREFIYKCMYSSTPQSSKMQCYIKVMKQNLKLKSSETLRKSIMRLKSRT